MIQRANKFTNYAGTFLYVEAHNKAISRVAGSNTQFTGPTLAVAYAGADGVFTPAAEAMAALHRHRSDAGRVHVQPPADPPDGRRGEYPGRPDDGPRRRQHGRPWTPSRSPSGSATTLPPHVAGYQQGFFSRYQDPTENRAQLDKLADRLPEPGHGGQPAEPDERLPAQVAGDPGRHGQHRHGAAGAVRRPLVESTGEITAAAPVASIPFNGTAGQRIFATVDGIPGGSTDFIFTLKNPAGQVIGGRSTRARARSPSPT